jgi:glycosyltransferase involved in cell wall biosynthesis
VFYKEAVSLAKNGFDVTLLVPQVDRRSLGLRREIKAVNVGSSGSHDVHFVPYRYNKSLPKQLGIRRYICRKDMLRKISDISADIYHFHEDGVCLEVASELKRFLPKKKLIFDFHESFVHQYRSHSKKRRKIDRYIRLENTLLEYADLLITVSDVLTDHYRTLAACPVVTVMNCQSERIFALPEEIPEDDGIFWVVHEGRMLFDRGLELLVDVARQLKDPAVKFLIVGDLPKAERAYLQEAAEEPRMKDRFRVTGFLPYLEVPRWLIRGKLGLDFRSSLNSRTGISNKFFNYLRFGIPVLSLSNPITDPLIKQHRLGFVFRENEPQRIAASIEQLSSDRTKLGQLSENVKTAFSSTFNWEVMERRLVEAYRELGER